MLRLATLDDPVCARVATRLGLPLTRVEQRDFEDGEHKTRPLESVRGDDVYVLQSLYADPHRSVNDRLVRLLFLLGALRDAGAARVTAVVPYLCYARKERRTKARDPVATRYVARLFEAVDVDRVVAVDVHDLAAFQNAFRCRTEHLSARALFAREVAARAGERPVVVVSPDAGGVKRLDAFRQAVERTLGHDVPTAFLEKYRSQGVVRSGAVVGDVDGRVAVILDDLVATGTTLARAASACRDRGAVSVLAAATHGLFVSDAPRALADPALEQVLVTDTVPAFRLPHDVLRDHVSVVGAAPLLAEAVRRLHDDGSLVDLLEGPAPA